MRLRAGVVGLVAALLAVLVVLPARGSEPPRDVSSVEPRDAANELAAAQLAEDYDVPIAEARARIARQTAIEAAASLIGETLGNKSAGTFIDHEAGGVLVVRSTDLDAARAAVATVGVPVRVELANTSSAAIEAARVRALGIAAASGATFDSIGEDVQGNRLLVSRLAGDAPAERAVRAIRAELGGAVPVAVEVVAQRAEPAACISGTGSSTSYCDDPLRGGVGMNRVVSSTAWSGCSVGFNAVSRSDGKPYILTAGHCGVKGQEWRTWMPKTQAIHVIGSMHNRFFSGVGDAAIVAVNNLAGWRPTNAVVVWSSGESWFPHPTRTTQHNDLYRITRVGSVPAVGSYLCSTGMVTRTRCGQVQALGQTLTYDGQTVAGLGKVAMASCKGDSGGPVYVDGAGYGLFVAISGSQVDNSFVQPWGSTWTTKCAATSYYQGLVGAQNTLNVSIRTS